MAKHKKKGGGGGGGTLFFFFYFGIGGGFFFFFLKKENARQFASQNPQKVRFFLDFSQKYTKDIFWYQFNF